MTDASAPKKGWLQRLTDGLSRSSRQLTEQVVTTLVKRPLDQAALDDLEEMLIEATSGPPPPPG
jgi:fused signal recognition particle receptor